MSGAETGPTAFAGSKGITFEGDFTAEERAVLTEQFSHCHFHLLRRARADPSRAVIVWSALPAFSPLGRERWGGAVPTAAPYVLHGRALHRVRSKAEAEAAFGEPLGDITLPEPAGTHPHWDAVQRALRGLIPWGVSRFRR
jgi:hypothetical protein